MFQVLGQFFIRGRCDVWCSRGCFGGVSRIRKYKLEVTGTITDNGAGRFVEDFLVRGL